MTSIKVNGVVRDLKDVPEDTPLLWALRDELGLTGTKYGCGVNECGACTVHIDGDAVQSCQTTVSEVGDSEVTTIEGLSEDGSHPVQQAWKELGVAQCGYCQVGQMMMAAALLKNNHHPTDEDIEGEMWNICRCGTYPRIRAAVKSAAQKMGQQEAAQ
ncbi:MAG: (2Fe-2S)-binding protein [Rhodopirellula sp. TMED11]|nr:MAG: (2Fe-2S)-binding protein [Rhodopirellula sp. TMED11]